MARPHLRWQRGSGDRSWPDKAKCLTQSKPVHTYSGRPVTRFLLVVSSMSPLIGIMAIRLIDLDSRLSIGLGICATIAALSLPAVLLARRSVEPQLITVGAVRNDSSQVAAYLVTYAFPFAFATSNSAATIAAYIVFGLLLLVLVWRTDLCLINPVLLAFGFHLFAVETVDGRSVTLISRDPPLVGSNLLAHRVLDGAYEFNSVS